MSAFAEFRKAFREASPANRRMMLQLVLFPYPTVMNNVVMYLNILFHLTIIYGVVGLGIFYGFERLVNLWGNVTLVRVLLYVFIGDFLLSAVVNRVSISLLKGIDARKRHEMAKLSRDVRGAIEQMMKQMEEQGVVPGFDNNNDNNDLLVNSKDLKVRERRVVTDDPIRTALEHLDDQDRAMTEQENQINRVHNENVDPIKNLLKQLEEHDRKNRRPDDD
jgi:hypothetical protein